MVTVVVKIAVQHVAPTVARGPLAGLPGIPELRPESRIVVSGVPATTDIEDGSSRVVVVRRKVDGILQVVRTIVLLHSRDLRLIIPAKILRDVGLAAEDADAGVVIDEGVYGVLAVVGSSRELVRK